MTVAPTMNLEGVLYIEAPEQDEHVPCTGCAFESSNTRPYGHCADSLRVARIAFGGGCGTRAVIYVRLPSSTTTGD